MLTFRGRSRSSKSPIRMELPLCVIGGFASIRLTRSSALELFQKPRLARISPTTRTWPPPPRRTLILPEPVRTSSSTGPSTVIWRSNRPVALTTSASRSTEQAELSAAASARTGRYSSGRAIMGELLAGMDGQLDEFEGDRFQVTGYREPGLTRLRFLRRFLRDLSL